MINIKQKIILLSILFIYVLLGSCSSGPGAVSAEEYYSLGMAYMDLGKYDEAEKWFKRAQRADKTKTASEYNLGRIAFETGRYEESAELFEDIIRKDPQNTMAMKAAAYARIKNGDLVLAENHYKRLLELVPESADDGYNYALVLFALGKTGEADAVISRYAFALQDNDDLLLLYARVQKAEHKIEAADSYDAWLKKKSDPQVRFEYAETLEYAQLYAKALENYREVLKADLSKSPNLKKTLIRFSIARTLLVADPSSPEGIAELRGAITDGFDDKNAVDELLKKEGISPENLKEIKNILDSMPDKKETPEAVVS